MEESVGLVLFENFFLARKCTILQHCCRIERCGRKLRRSAASSNDIAGGLHESSDTLRRSGKAVARAKRDVAIAEKAATLRGRHPTSCSIGSTLSKGVAETYGDR